MKATTLAIMLAMALAASAFAHKGHTYGFVEGSQFVGGQTKR